jgi:prevent-host-death family protein
MIKAKRIGARAARNEFADLIGRVHYSGEPVIVERAGKPMVAVIPIELYEKLIGATIAAPSTPSASLFGAFPELGVLDDSDFEQAKQVWRESINKQHHMLQEGD